MGLTYIALYKVTSACNESAYNTSVFRELSGVANKGKINRSRNRVNENYIMNRGCFAREDHYQKLFSS